METDGNPTLTPELADPVTGELIDLRDPDTLFDALERLRDFESRLSATKATIIAAIAAMAPSGAGTKTVRVRGRRRSAMLEMPDDSWDQSKLREAYHAYPQFRDEFLQIAALRVRLREWKKAEHTSGPEDFETFKQMIQAANRGPRGLPRITIEK